MPTLSTELFDRAVRLLLPAMCTKEDRQTVLFPLPFNNAIEWEGAPQQFTVRLVKLLSHDELLAVLARLTVGEEQRKEILDVRARIEQEWKTESGNSAYRAQTHVAESSLVRTPGSIHFDTRERIENTRQHLRNLNDIRTPIKLARQLMPLGTYENLPRYFLRRGHPRKEGLKPETEDASRTTPHTYLSQVLNILHPLGEDLAAGILDEDKLRDIPGVLDEEFWNFIIEFIHSYEAEITHPSTAGLKPSADVLKKEPWTATVPRLASFFLSPLPTAPIVRTALSARPLSADQSGARNFAIIVEELDKVFSRVATLFKELATSYADKDAAVAAGALPDAVYALHKFADKSMVQLAAAYLGGPDDRNDLQSIVACLADAVRSLERARRSREDYRLDPVLVRKIVRLHDKRAALQNLYREIVGRFPHEAFVIETIFDHGNRFPRVKENISTLLKFLEYGSDDPDVRAFLARKIATDYRYLGLLAEARRAIGAVDIGSVSDGILRPMAIEMKYSSRLPEFIEDPKKLTENGTDFASSLLADCRIHLHVDLEDCDERRLKDLVESASSEAIEPIGQYYRWMFFRAADEADAQQYFDKTLSVARVLVKVGSDDPDFGDYADRKAWWQLASLLPYAYFRGYRKLSKHIVSACERGDCRRTIFEPAALGDFHAMERERLRSPVYMEYLLIRSLLEHEEKDDSDYFASAFVRNKRLHVSHNAVLQKSVARIGAHLGIVDRNALLSSTSAKVDDGHIMMKCVTKALGQE